MSRAGGLPHREQCAGADRLGAAAEPHRRLPEEGALAAADARGGTELAAAGGRGAGGASEPSDAGAAEVLWVGLEGEG